MYACLTPMMFLEYFALLLTISYVSMVTQALVCAEEYNA